MLRTLASLVTRDLGFARDPVLIAQKKPRPTMSFSVRDRLTLSLAGWSAACVLFLILNVLAVVHVQYNLARIPARRGNGASRVALVMGIRA